MRLQPGQRKVTYGSIAVLALILGAWRLEATYSEFANAIIFWLGIMAGSHVAQQATQKPMPKENEP